MKVFLFRKHDLAKYFGTVELPHVDPLPRVIACNGGSEFFLHAGRDQWGNEQYREVTHLYVNQAITLYERQAS